MTLFSNFVLYFLCSVSNCNYQHDVPSDPLGIGEGRRSGRTFHEIEPYPVVRTNIGEVKGYVMKTITQRSIYAFEGIPYGEDTGGKNRFQPPVPKAPWRGVRNAFKTGNMCLQANPLRVTLPIQGAEDCLFLNIYTHTNAMERGQKYPVLFWIHGGSFFYGAGSDTGPAYMLEKDVILVTINYRLGILGFLSTGDDLIPGNMGLKDQALALKWVYENIESFGGDLSKITMIGESAGGASVNYHMLSRSSSQYFSAAILMSGSALHPWAFRGLKTRKILNRKLAKFSRCPDGTTEQFYTCIKRINPYFLTGMQLRMFPVHFVQIILFGPVDEKLSSNSTVVPFLTKRPEKIYDEGAVAKVPTLFTKTSGEADIPSMIAKGYGYLGERVFRTFWKGSGMGLLEYHFSDDPVDKFQQTEDQYLRGRSSNDADLVDMDEIITDRFHGVGTHKAIQRQSQVSTTHAMLISGPIQHGMLSSILGIPQGNKVLHADDVFLIFNGTEVMKPLKTSDQDYVIMGVLTEAISHFATYRNTNFTRLSPAYEDWSPVLDPCNVGYWNLTDHGASMTPLPRRTTENYKFLQNLGLIDTLRNPYDC